MSYFEKPDAVVLAESWQQTLSDLPSEHTLVVTIAEMLCLSNWIVNQWRVIQPNQDELDDLHEEGLDQLREEHGSEQEVEDV